MATNIVDGRKPNAKLSMRDPLYNTKLQTPSVDNNITNTMVSSGTLPASQAETTPRTNVPVTTLESPTKPLDIPQTSLPQGNEELKGAQSAGQSIISGLESEAQAKQAQAGQVLSESDRRIREAMGLLSTEEATRGKLESQMGVDQYSQDVSKFSQNLRQQLADLDQFDLDNINTIESMRVEGSKRDMTKRTFGAQSAEANLQMSIQRAGAVAQTRATIAAIDIAQGNLQAATTQVDKALKTMYEPIKMGLEMEMYFNQRNYSQFTAAQKEVSDAKMLGAQRELDAIDRATELVNAAVSSGGASPEDVQAMMSETNPTKQSQYAMSILAQVNSADRALERATKQMQIENIQDQIRERNAVSTEGKPLTQAQYTALGYAERVVDASTVIDAVGANFTGMFSGIGQILPNQLKSEDRQKYEQAQRNFVNAVLRRESGAAIAPSEFESAAQQYFPQPGDSVGVIAQKKVNRETVQRSLLREGGQPTEVQDKNINDPLGLGFPAETQTDPLGLTSQSTSKY